MAVDREFVNIAFSGHFVWWWENPLVHPWCPLGLLADLCGDLVFVRPSNFWADFRILFVDSFVFVWYFIVFRSQLITGLIN